MLTKASFNMTRNIRKNVPLITRVSDDAWMVRGQLPFPQGLHYIYNAFAGKNLADVFAHPFFLERDHWPDQPSPQFHLTDEVQSTMLVVKGMIHMKDSTTHLDNTMVVCRNPRDHSEFGIYNPTHVEEQSLDHVLKLVEGCGVEPNSSNSSETFAMHSTYGGGKGGYRLGNSGAGGGGDAGMTMMGSKTPNGPRASQVRDMMQKHKQQQQQHHNSGDNNIDDEGDDAQQHEDRVKQQYGDIFKGKQRVPGMIEGDPRLYSDAPWRNLAYRDPEDQLPEEFKKKLRESSRTAQEKQDAAEAELARIRREQEQQRLNSGRKGTVKWIVVPSRQTWQALELWRQRFPDAQIFCSGNVPAHLTKEGVAHGAIPPSAFSLPSGFAPGLPTPKSHEGTDSSGMMMSSGGYGAKTTDTKKQRDSGAVKKFSGSWQKSQIDLTRTRVEFYRSEHFDEHSENSENVLQRARAWERLREQVFEERQKQQQQQQQPTTKTISDEASSTTTAGDLPPKKEKRFNSSCATNFTIATFARLRYSDKAKLFGAVSDPHPEFLRLDAAEVPPDTVKVPKPMEQIEAELADGKPYVPERDGFIAVPATPLDNVQILPRDGTIFELFGGAFQLLRVAGDPRTNEFCLFQPDAAMLACTDLFHGTYADFDPMNTWLVRVWFKFQRGGLFKDAGLLPAFRLNELRSLPGGGIARVQRFVDDLTRGVELRTLVFAHGSGPLVASAEVFKNNSKKLTLTPQDERNYVANALRAQYGLASLEEAVATGLQHPVTLHDLYEWRKENGLAVEDPEDVQDVRVIS